MLINFVNDEYEIKFLDDKCPSCQTNLIDDSGVIGCYICNKIEPTNRKFSFSCNEWNDEFVIAIKKQVKKEKLNSIKNLI